MPHTTGPTLPVVVLCGGPGTRMQDAVATTANGAPAKKELIKIGDRPVIWHVMKIYAAYGHTRFILALGHQAEAIKRYFIEYEPMSHDFSFRLGQPAAISYHQTNTEEDWQITLADTGLNTEKGGRIHRVARYIDSDTFFVTYGEALGNVDLDALLAFHRQHGRLATVTGTRMQSHLGVFDLDEAGQVTGFVEKPQLDHWINAGFMLLERGVFDYLASSASGDLERDVLPRLVAAGQLMMYRHTGFWRSMKTFKDAQEMNALWEQSKPWKVW